MRKQTRLFGAVLVLRDPDMAFAQAMRCNTTVSAADARLASMASAAKIAEHRLQRSQERSKWYTLSEDER